MPATYLEECIENKHNVKVYTVNGFQMTCCIIHDGGSHIIVKCNGKNRMIYKHAISTIEPT